MAQQQTENLNDVGAGTGGGGGGGQNVEDKKNLQNGTDGTKSPAMNEKIKSPPPNNGNDGSQQQPPMTHQPMPPHHPPPHPHHPYDQSIYGPPPPHGGPPPHGIPPPGHLPPNNDKDEMNHMYGHPPPPGHPHHPPYGRYHHDPNLDPYRYGHPPMPVPGGKPGGGPPPGVIGSPNRPPPQQRYIPGQTPQGPTPTLNSLLQSHSPSPQSQQQQQQPPPQQQPHRYSNNYDPAPPGAPPQQPQQQPLPPTSQSSQQQPPPPQHQPPPPGPYGAPQQGWAPPPRPYSPQMGPSQQYRTPPPANPSRGQSTYPPPPQNSGSYPNSPQQQPPPQQQQQQPGGPPPPPNSNQGGGNGPPPPPPSSQYAPYPQRYPTPPTGPNSNSGGSGPSHRTPYSQHQYPEPNRPWPGSPSPAPSPGPGGHPLPPASPHQPQNQPPPPSSPSGGGVHAAPSPSPQPSQASPSPHQELIGQNSNDSSSGGGVSGTPGTPNSQQQVMRPTPSPTGSAGSRSLSPAIGQRPSSNQSQSSNSQQPMPPTTSVLMPHTNSSVPPPPTSSSNSQPVPPTGGPPPPGINNMPTSAPGTYSTQAPPHMMGYKPPQGPGQSPYPPPPQGQQYSQASGEDPQCTTPKSRKNDPYQSHLAAPITSPGAGAPGTPGPYPPPHTGSAGTGGGTGGGGSDDFDMRSPPPSWPSTPASPGFNSHVQQETFRPTPSNKKSDSLGKLYEMDEMPERRPWLDKLLGFMEERKTPITACPTISKTPLDLYRLYLYVKERGGFVEVTKSKTWKDIAGLLGIGASSSAAYTLRKHYTKNLLAFECHFDRGGIDPMPIIAQVEAGSKKKSSKAASVPSPAGSSNSQDSFPNQAGANTNIDGYPGYTGPGGYPPPQGAPGPDYNAVPQRPPSQTNAQTHPGPYPGQPGYNQYGATDQYNSGGPPGPGQYPQNQGQFPPPNRPMYPPYGPEGAEGPPPGSNAYGPYGNRPYNQPPGPGGATQPPPPQAPPTSGSSTPPSGPPPSGPPGQQSPYPPPAEYSYRPPDPQQQRRHPDFVKDQPYPGYNQRPQMYPAWQGSQGPYRGGPYANAPPQSQQWPTGPRSQAPGGPQGSANQQPIGPGGQWDQHRYPPQSQQPYPQPGAPGGPQQQWGNMPSPQQQPAQQPPSSTPGSPLRPPNQQQRMPLPPGGKPFNMPPPPQNMPPQTGGPQNKMAPHHMPPHPPMGPPPQGANAGPGVTAQMKKEITFPSDSVEATTPNFVRRKRLTRSDVCPIDPWRIFMALKSGLLAESTWALDLLNILLFDDSAVQYFGLSNLPGLLNLLLEHFQKNLTEMFDEPTVNGKIADKRRRRMSKYSNNLQKSIKQEDGKADENDNDIDLGQITTIPNGDDRIFLLANTPNYTMMSRKGVPVRIQNSDDDIFISDDKRSWDMDANKNYQYTATAGSDAWNYDQFEPDPHENIIDVFKSEIIDIPFARCYRKRKISASEDKENVVIKDIKVEADDKMDIDERVVKKEVLEDEEQQQQQQSMTEDDEGNDSETFNPIKTVRDPATILKRRKISDFEDECYTRDEASIHLINESHDSLARRCICISNIFRNLTFVPGNESILAKSPKFLAIMGKLLLLNHEHLIRTHKTGNYDREEDTDFTDSCSSLQGEKEWWWEYLIQIRENMLVAVANIAGHLELSRYEEIIARPVLDGLLHWAICPSAHGQDPFPSCGPHSSLSPQRLALEALCKLCVTDANVDLVIATPPFNRLEKLCAVLTRHLCKNEDQVLREFSVNLLHYLAAADSAMARTVALQSPCISYLVTFIEQAEQTALGVANQHGINYLRENPDSMGTSLDMLRRAAGTLLHLSRHPDNKSFFMQQEQRLLGLVMSHILDQQVALIISRVLFQVSRSPPSPPAMFSSKPSNPNSAANVASTSSIKRESSLTTLPATTTSSTAKSLVDDTNSSDSSVVPPNDISNSSNSSLSNCSSEATTSSTTPTTTSLSTTLSTTSLSTTITTATPASAATKTTPATATQAAVA